MLAIDLEPALVHVATAFLPPPFKIEVGVGERPGRIRSITARIHLGMLQGSNEVILLRKPP